MFAVVRGSSKKIQSILEDTKSLQTLLHEYQPTVQEALTTLESLSTQAASTIRNTESLVSDTEGLLQSAGTQADTGAKQTLEGLAAALRATANSLNKTGDIKTAKNSMSTIIEDTWTEYTGDANNLLLMDATASAQSLTDTRNPAPTSVQVLIRTQEIKSETSQQTQATATQTKTTFWGRVSQMFQDFWAAVTGIFH